jgi:protein O-mannosyl-transferase
MNGGRGTFTILCLLLVALTGALYSPVKSHPFINFDDDSYITNNSHVRAGLTWSTFVWAWTATDSSNWHPLTWLSHALDCQLYGLNPAGHHLTSVLLHCLNVGLLFFLLVRITGKTGRSGMVAALFALHPFNVESVAWVAERKNVLSTLFFLLALGAYGWYARRPNFQRYLLVSAMFALGLASKPMVITIPFVFLLLDFWPLRRIQGWSPQPAMPGLKGRKNRNMQEQVSPAESSFSVAQLPFTSLVLEKLPLLAFSVGSAVITLIAQGTAVRSFTRIPFLPRLENAVSSYALYVWKAFWPAQFALFYPHPLHRLTGWQTGLALLFLAGVSALVWQQRSARPYLATGWLWYVGTMVPVIGIVQVGDQAMADRYAYLPLIGIFVMVIWSAADWADASAFSRPLSGAVAATVLAILAFLTWRQIGYWRSREELWTHTLQVTDHNPVAENNLADALRTLGRLDEALAHSQYATQLQPNDPTFRVNLGSALAESGRLRDAIQEYTVAIQLSSDPTLEVRAYESLASLYSALGDYSKVRENYQEALQIDPQQGQEMISHLSQSVATQPEAEIYMQLGLLFEQTGQVGQARVAYEQALKLDPGLGEAKKSLDALGGGNRSGGR